MAVQYFGVERGQPYTTITQDSSTTSKDLEVSVDLAANMTKEEVLTQLDEIKGFILNNIWPPA